MNIYYYLLFNNKCIIFILHNIYYYIEHSVHRHTESLTSWDLKEKSSNKEIKSTKTKQYKIVLSITEHRGVGVV
jgi:hypothetical protein